MRERAAAIRIISPIATILVKELVTRIFPKPHRIKNQFMAAGSGAVIKKASILACAVVALTACGGGGESGDAVLAHYLDFDAAYLTKYKDNKLAAASYMFDDGLQSSFQIASIFEVRGLRASFYIMPGRIGENDWPRWRNLAEHGHEVGNHSWSHVNLTDANLSDEDLHLQINEAQSEIERRIGIRPHVFVFPYSLHNERAVDIVYKTHMATRLPGFYSDPTYRILNILSTTTAEQLDYALVDVLKIKGWHVAAGHGVDGDGWEPMQSQLLDQHLAFAQSYSKFLWVDTFVNVARYANCRTQGKPSIVQSDNAIVLRLVGDFSVPYCTAELTVAIPKSQALVGQFRAYTAAGEERKVGETSELVLVNLRPGEEVHLSIHS